METVYWGFESAKSQKNNKRAFNDYDDSESDDAKCGDAKKVKLFREVNKMIYSIGNEIHFCDGITDESIEAIIKKITKIINKNHEKYDGTDEKLNISIIISSPGGSVHAILKFVDFIKMCKKKYSYLEFTSVITGCVASAGTIMSVCMDHRHMTKYGKAMVHELSSGRSGKYTHLKSYTEHLTDLHDTLVDIYLEKCGKSREEVEAILSKETWYNAEQYLAAGFVEKIV